MRWLVAAVLLYLARSSDAGALKCHPGSRDPQCTLEKKEISDPITCKPNTEFMRDGSICTCLEDGLVRCPLSSQQGWNVLQTQGSEQECIPGSSFMRSCNSCSCTSDGKAICTKKGCLDNMKRKKKREIEQDIPEVLWSNEPRTKRSVCKPHSEFNVDCNPCKCAANGLSYTCTHNECLEGGETDANKEVEVFMETEGTDHIEQHSVCKPRATFYVGCNTCRCNAYGNDYSCTNKPCPLPEDVELFHELKTTSKPSNSTRVVCVANRMFIKDCNTCWCNEDGTSYFCTRRVCIEMPDDQDAENQDEELKLRVVRKECTPNAVFEMDCNMCRCDADGMSFSCTRRACVVDEKDTTLRRVRAITEPPKACQPGLEFRLDCNKCLCNDEGKDYSCTRIDCAAAAPETRRKRDTTAQVPMECQPDSVFDRDCNVCRCTADGQHATCTLKSCTKNAERSTESSSSYRCTPGDQFKRDCNDCTCSADGKSVNCTLRLCDPEIEGE